MSSTYWKAEYPVQMYVTSRREVEIEGESFYQPDIHIPAAARKDLLIGPYSEAGGWFTAGYGPFRRLSGGGSEENQRLAGSAGRLVTLFRESAALTQCENWLVLLQNMANDPTHPLEFRGVLKEKITTLRWIINSLLPFDIRITSIGSQNAIFKNQSDVEVKLSELSDGFRSFLSLVIDILSQIFNNNWEQMIVKDPATSLDLQITVGTEGVVFIDEADVHLHPSWQRELKERLCRIFPRIQFIVSTHSPFIAQAASPDGLFILENRDNAVQVRQSADSVRGWAADQILLSPLFGLKSTRDPETDRMITRRAELLGLAERNTAQAQELEQLTGILQARLSAPGDSLYAMDTAAMMEAYVRRRSERV